MNKVISTKGIPTKWNLLCFLFFTLNSCSENSVYEKNIPIINNSWSQQQVLEFKPHISNVNQNFDVFLNLRHTSKYKFSNLSLIIQEINPSKEEKTYRLELQLANPDGRWKGIGTGNILSSQIPFLKDHHFVDTGIYTFKVKPNMNINPIPEILDIGIRIAN